MRPLGKANRMVPGSRLGDIRGSQFSNLFYKNDRAGHGAILQKRSHFATRYHKKTLTEWASVLIDLIQFQRVHDRLAVNAMQGVDFVAENHAGIISTPIRLSMSDQSFMVKPPSMR
jgi:hypothetical protein